MVRESLPIAHHLLIYWMLKPILWAKRVPRPPNYHKAIVSFRKYSRDLLEAKPDERNPIIREIYDRFIELNTIGIDQIQTYKDTDALVKACLALKNEVVRGRNLDKASQFLKSSDELFALRENSIGIQKRKNEKQEEIRQLIRQWNVLTEKDVIQFAGAVVLDSVTNTGYATAAKLGDITAKYSIKELSQSLMSPKILNRSIRLTELRQRRYREWREALDGP